MTRKIPAGPPAYRPQPTPMVLQRKMPAHQTAIQSRPGAVAPPAYRPQPVPRVLQTKSALGKQTQAIQKVGQPVAPPVYRPEPNRIVQPKVAVAAYAQKPPSALPSRSLNSGTNILQAKTSQRSDTGSVPNDLTRPNSQTLSRHKPAEVSRQQSKGSRNPFDSGIAGSRNGGLEARPSGRRAANQGKPVTIQMSREQWNTIYTHTNTKPTSKLTTTPQGPHTVASTLVGYGYQQETEDEDWERLGQIYVFNVPDGASVRAIVATEKPGKLTTKMQAQLDRYFEEYENLYNKVTKGINAQKNFDAVSALMRELMELHPYQTYSWKSGKPAAKSSTNGKGEGDAFKKWKQTGNTSDLMNLLDISRAKFNDRDAFKGFIEARLIMAGADADSINEILDQI